MDENPVVEIDHVRKGTPILGKLLVLHRCTKIHLQIMQL